MTSLADGRVSFFLAAQFGPGQCISRFATNSNLNGLKLYLNARVDGPAQQAVTTC